MKRSSRMVIAILGLVTLALSISSQASAKVKAKNFGTVNQQISAVAIGPDGNPHVAYQGPDFHLYHARFDGRRWQRELVDGSSEGGWGNAIAVDADGHVHITYGAYRGLGAQQLVHAYFDGATWQVNDLGVDGTLTHLQLDAAGHPHVLFAGSSSYGYAVHNGISWQIEDTGLPWSWYSAGMVLDADGYAHVAHTANYLGCFYSTNRSGAWETTTLVAGTSAASAITLDAAGNPQVAVGSGTALSLFRYDGAAWSEELVVDFGIVAPLYIDSNIAMTTNAYGRPLILAAVSYSAGDQTVEVPFFLFDDGYGWNGDVIKNKNQGLYPSLALADSGIIYGTYCSLGRASTSRVKAKWLSFALPDLSGSWSNLSLVEAGGTAHVTGLLTIRNDGFDKSPRTSVMFLLSDDDVPDPGDELLPLSLRLKALRTGTPTELTVQFDYAGVLAGKTLFAIIDPEGRTLDGNLTDNLVPVLLGAGP